MLDDSAVEIYEHEDGSITEYPHNSPDVYSGRISVADALAYSKNTVAVRLYKMLGAESIYKNLTDSYGFDTIVREGESGGGKITDLAASPLALGQLSYGIPLRKLTEAYTVFPSEGRLARARSYVLVLDSQGRELIRKDSSYTRVMSSECARVMNAMLSRVTQLGTASKITLDEMLDTAGKTGTSASSRDKLFIGYTPYYTAGIWCGYADNSRSVTGTPHLDIWDAVMKDVHRRYLRDIDTPRSFSYVGLARVAYCRDTGLRFSPHCLADEASTLEYGFYIRGTEPQQMCKHPSGLPAQNILVAEDFTFRAPYVKIKKRREGSS
jgi:penicillin-binding protein 1A